MVTLRQGLNLIRQGEFVNLPDSTQWFGLSQTTGQLTLVVFSLGVLVLLALALRHLAAGRFLYAVGTDAEAARLAGTRKVVFASSGGTVYGEVGELPTLEDHDTVPLCPYGVGKRAGEHYLEYYHRVHGLQYVALRYANVYRPRQDPHGEAGVVAIFAGRLLDRQPVVIFGDGSQTRDFVFVEDVADAFVRKGGVRSSNCVLPDGSSGPNGLITCGGRGQGKDPDGIPWGGGRADVRLAIDGDGELYLMSKGDGMIRKLTAVVAPPTR